MESEHISLFLLFHVPCSISHVFGLSTALKFPIDFRVHIGYCRHVPNIWEKQRMAVYGRLIRKV